MSSQGDVTVFGLMVPTCVIVDIGMDVPHGRTIVVPAEKAHVSKDLWRLIGQKCLFQMRSGPYAPQPPMSQVARIPAQQERLEVENAELRETLVRQQQEFQAAQKESKDKLDAILLLLQSGALATGSQAMMSGAKAGLTSSGVDGSAPSFIPTTITPENAQARIESKKEESASSATSSASKLRELRKKGNQ